MAGQSLTAYDPFTPARIPATHYNTHPRAATDKLRQPLCGATSADGRGIAGGYYTTDPNHVTCKRCLKRFEKQLDEAVGEYLKAVVAARKRSLKS